MVIIQILLFLAILGVIVLVHEFGHFYFARKAGILIHEFSIGMGPAIYSKRSRDDILFSIKAFPIGGSVAMSGEEINESFLKEGQNIWISLEKNEISKIYFKKVNENLNEGHIIKYESTDDGNFLVFSNLEGQNRYRLSKKCKIYFNKNRYYRIANPENLFQSKTISQRFKVIFGGPLMNFILAFIIYIAIAFFVMAPDLKDNTIGSIQDGGPASILEIRTGDRITSINGELVNDWNDISEILYSSKSIYANVTIMSENGDLNVYDKLLLDSSIVTIGFSNLRQGENGGAIIDAFGRAHEAGIENQSTLRKLTHNEIIYEIYDVDDVIDFFTKVQSGQVEVEYTTDDFINKTTTVTLISKETLEELGYNDIYLQLGVGPMMKSDLLYSISYPFVSIYENFSNIFTTIRLLFSPNQGVDASDLSGPIGIFSLISRASSEGVIELISFTAFLSINIGVLNLLPIPALDGGRLVFLLYEWIFKRKIHPRIENLLNYLVFYFLMGLIVYVTYNDLLRLF